MGHKGDLTIIEKVSVTYRLTSSLGWAESRQVGSNGFI
jgi:hypothetical protein